MPTFLVNCAVCKARVAATEEGIANQGGGTGHEGEPIYGERLLVGKCPECYGLVAGHSTQVAIAGYDSEDDEWSLAERIYPRPPRVITYNAPGIVRQSMSEAEVCIQVGANTAACVMFGRAVEAMCRNKLKDGDKFMLGKGLKQLRDEGVIDAKLYAWGTQLSAFRNAAAHPDEEQVFSEQDVEDLRAFAYAIIEYVYDLSDRYADFVARMEQAKAKAKAIAAKKAAGK